MNKELLVLAQTLDRNSFEPVYHQIKRGLEQMIVAGGARHAGTKLLPEEHIASTLEVTRGTVRKAIANLTEDGLLVRHRGKGTFVRAAKAAPKLESIGFLVAHKWFLSGYFCTQQLLGAKETLADAGVQMKAILLDSEEFEDAATDSGLDAVIAIGDVMPPEVVDAVAAWPKPKVMTMTRSPHPSLPSVCFAEEAVAYDQVVHLANQGHRHIAMVYSHELSRHQRRLEGYRQAHADLGLPVRDDHLIARIMDGKRGSSVAEQVLALPTNPTAIVFPMDAMACEAVYSLRQQGIRVPEDISVVATGGGESDHPLMDVMNITTTWMSYRDLGRVATRTLLEQAAGQSTHNLTDLRSELTVGMTTGTAPQ